MSIAYPHQTGAFIHMFCWANLLLPLLIWLPEFVSWSNLSLLVMGQNYQPNKKVHWDTNFDPTPFLDISGSVFTPKIGMAIFSSIHSRNRMCVVPSVKWLITSNNDIHVQGIPHSYVCSTNYPISTWDAAISPQHPDVFLVSIPATW